MTAPRGFPWNVRDILLVEGWHIATLEIACLLTWVLVPLIFYLQYRSIIGALSALSVWSMVSTVLVRYTRTPAYRRMLINELSRQLVDMEGGRRA